MQEQQHGITRKLVQVLMHERQRPTPTAIHKRGDGVDVLSLPPGCACHTCTGAHCAPLRLVGRTLELLDQRQGGMRQCEGLIGLDRLRQRDLCTNI
jgi:hypothetical protein